MFDSVVWARKNLGTKACRMFPAKATVQLALLSDEEIFAEKVLFWKSVYGVDMSALMYAQLTADVTRTAALNVTAAPMQRSVHSRSRSLRL